MRLKFREEHLLLLDGIQAINIVMKNVVMTNTYNKAT